MTGPDSNNVQSLPRLLIIDDQIDECVDLAALLSESYQVNCAHSAEEGLLLLHKVEPDLVLLDIDLRSQKNGLELLLDIRRESGSPPVIMLTGDIRISTAVEAMRRGAYHYLTKPPDPDELEEILRRALADLNLGRRLKSLERDLASLHGEIVTQDDRMLEILNQVTRVAPTDATVLITGESGTGKELIARRIHKLSSRRQGPFIALNCAAVPSELIESELFGHEKGAFTSAIKRKQGVFEQARGGTLFLDEIGDSPSHMQVKLLRVLEERSFVRVGGESPLRADLRILAATSKDVDQQVSNGELRAELYFRLNVFRFTLPPLRERPGDILALTEHFIRIFSSKMGKTILGFNPAAATVLTSQSWSGNVRELRNVIERAVIMADGEELDLPHLSGLDSEAREVILPYEEAKQEILLRFKRTYLATRLRAGEGNVTRAAELSGIRRQSFQRMIQEAGLDVENFRKRS